MNTYSFKNRELSWLDFNERVLQEAEDISVPLIERLRFIGIFSNNLDEFYKIRYATVKRIALSNQKAKKLYKGESAKDLLNKITLRAINLQEKSTIIFNSILKDLKKENIHIINEKNIPQESLQYLNDFFQNKVFPNLKIVLLNENDTFPQLTDFSSFLIVSIKSKNKKLYYALIQLPTEINRFIVLEDKNKKNILMIDDLIRYNLNQLFKIFDPLEVTANMIKFSRDAELDFDDDSLTANMRCAYPLEYIANASESALGGHPKNIIMLTCDAFGVLPPIARLSPAQAMYHFLSGFTSKVAGTERGVTEPEPTFSTCFGAPFMPRRPEVYGNLLRSKIASHGATCWLVNTGWTGGAYGTGQRMPIKATRALLTAALNGSLSEVEFRKDTNFGFDVPITAPGVEPQLLDPKTTWADGAAYEAQAQKLVKMFADNFEQYVPFIDEDVKAIAIG